MGRPGYLRGVSGLSGRLADALEADDAAHSSDPRGLLSADEEQELDGALESAKARVREARTRWETEQADGHYR